VLYGGIPGQANLNTMGYLGGSVECGMMNAAIHQMAHHIRVPNYNSSALTDSKIPDQQAAWERARPCWRPWADPISSITRRMLDSMIAVAYEQYVIDDEIIGMACKVLKGIVWTPSTWRSMWSTRWAGSDFMAHVHTLAHAHGIFQRAMASPTTRAVPLGAGRPARCP
jgi:trimethylamine--corrinoid protein Co-methyltransferase